MLLLNYFLEHRSSLINLDRIVHGSFLALGLEKLRIGLDLVLLTIKRFFSCPILGRRWYFQNIDWLIDMFNACTYLSKRSIIRILRRFAMTILSFIQYWLQFHKTCYRNLQLRASLSRAIILMIIFLAQLFLCKWKTWPFFST